MNFDEGDDDGYDMVTGANLTPHIVPGFLTGRTMQSRTKTAYQQGINADILDTTLPAQQSPVPYNNQDAPTETTVDRIIRLADVFMGMHNKPSAQTLMVRPVSTTTLTFDGKSVNFEFFENLFQTMIKMQPEMTETMEINHFHSSLQKMPFKLSAISTRQIGKH